ncbi:hypothetical protein H4R33_001587 [Dimargaris cristalligena]|nr:hypothetical protein H4R33_001587 [Dimargaris cristalligena]
MEFCPYCSGLSCKPDVRICRVQDRFSVITQSALDAFHSAGAAYKTLKKIDQIRGIVERMASVGVQLRDSAYKRQLQDILTSRSSTIEQKDVAIKLIYQYYERSDKVQSLID